MLESKLTEIGTDHDQDIDSEIDILEFDSAIGSYSALRDGSREKYLKIFIVTSLCIHLTLFAAVPRLFSVPMSSSISDPNEQVTKVRLIEPTAPDSPKEPPPEHASAISDRDHTALKEKKPKIVTPPKAPLGTVEPFDKRMAALPPPTAPEDLREKKEDRKEDVKEDSRKPKQTPPESLNKSKPKLSDSPSKRDLKNRNVDLRPTIQDLAKGLSGAPGSPDFFPDGEIEEAVVDINTREDRFFSYLLHLKRKIQGVWIYPSVAAKSGLGGSLTVEFSIANTGELLNVNLLDSSGHSILDESAMKAIKSAAPYYPFPSRMRAKKLRVRANFIYVTESFFRNIM